MKGHIVKNVAFILKSFLAWSYWKQREKEENTKDMLIMLLTSCLL